LKYNKNGTIAVTPVSGLTFTGLFAADGSTNVVESDGSDFVGVYNPCGAMNVTFTDSQPPIQGYAPDGSILMNFSVPGGAAAFDGTNDYLARGAEFTGLADSKVGIVSMWVLISGGDGGTRRLLFVPSTRFAISIIDTNVLQVLARNAADTGIMTMTTTPTYLAGPTWLHILSSWDLATTTRLLYVNDAAPALAVNTASNDTIDYTNANWGVGATNAGVGKLQGAMADVFFDDTFLDISVEANRRKFISSTGRPVSLGHDGSIPLGAQPILFLSGNVATWHVNKGSGGGFNLNGALTTATTSPSD
jgi:hypothetical protein